MPTLPPVAKTYSARANAPFQAVATALNIAQSAIFSLKEHMKDTLAVGTVAGTRHANSVWTVRYSCDSVTAGSAGDAVDRWASIANLIWAANNVAHSWFVLRNATLGYEVCLDCTPLNSTQIGIAITEIATPFTGGTTLTRPTGTNEWSMGNTAIGATSNFLYLGDAATGNFNWNHYITADDGQFFYLCSRTGLGLFSTFIALQKTTAVGADTRNVFALGHGTATVRGAPAWVTIGTTAAGCIGRAPNGGLNVLGGIQRAGDFGATAVPGNIGIDSVTGNYLAFPCAVASLSAAQPSFRGVFPDLYAVSTAPLAGSIPSAAAQVRIIAGDFIIPFPTVNPTI